MNEFSDGQKRKDNETFLLKNDKTRNIQSYPEKPKFKTVEIINDIIKQGFDQLKIH